MRFRHRVLYLTLLGMSFHCAATAQWAEQTIHLQPGWNAVFFEVEPYPRDCDTVFARVPVESVWGWNRRFTSVQFVQDPETLLPEQPEWLTYFPPSSPRKFLTNLDIISGGRPYLVKLMGSQAVDLVVTGRPKVRRIDWFPDSFNFVGFNVDAASPPTFASFFAPAAAHAGQPIYRMGASGRWERVANPAAERIQPGQGYWVYCQGVSKYQGPVSVTFDAGDGLDYARILIERELRIQNASASSCSVTIRQLPSGAPPGDPGLPALAGDVPLSHFEFDLTSQKYGWTELSGPLRLAVPAGGELALRLMVRRPDMAAFTPPAGREALYQSLLQLSDGAGLLLVLPVSAKGLSAPRVVVPAVASAARAKKASGHKDEPALAWPTGLWVGDATIKAVSNPTSGSLDPDEPTSVSAPFTFRLIIHVDSSGRARLLQQVLQMWKDGAWIENPDDPTGETFILDTDNPGRTVLLTDDALIPQFKGVMVRDIELVGRRISTAAFGFRQPIDMGGGYLASYFGNPDADPTNCVIVTDYQDPLNPFKHKYHPEHDNVDRLFENPLPEGNESYTTTRTIALQFTARDPEGRESTGWGDELLGGIYSEVIQGIHYRPIRIRGTFRLQRISDVGVLNDGLL